MDPMAVDMLGCLDGDQCSDKTQLADAVGAEALFLPVIGRAICGGCVPDVSDVTQCVRCSLTAERLFGVLAFGFWANSFFAGLTPH